MAAVADSFNIYTCDLPVIIHHLKQKEIQPSELIESTIGRIEVVDENVNALPIRCFERAFKQSKVFDALGDNGDPRNLRGLPIVVKDYNDVGGVRTT